MLNDMLKSIISQTFEKECGRWQSRKAFPKAFLMTISFQQDSQFVKKQLALFSEFNFVQIYERTIIKEDKTEWKLLIDHDSEWKTEIGNWLFKHREDVGNFYGSTTWYQLIFWDNKNINQNTL